MGKLAGAPALDSYLHQSYELIQYVADNMAAIKAVAGHLTPVEDLVDFQATIAELYGKLGLLVEASELLIQTTEAGIQLLLAPDAAAQRMVLGLGTAATQTADYFAKTTDLAELSLYVDEIKSITDQLDSDLNTRVTPAELAAAIAGLQSQIDTLGDATGISDRIDGILIQLASGGLTTTLTAAVDELGNQLTSLTQQLHAHTDNADAQLEADALAINQLSVRTGTVEGVIAAQAESLLQLTADANNLATGLDAQADALQQLTVLATNTDGAQTTTANAVTQLDGRVTDAESATAAAVEAVQQLSTDLSVTQAGVNISAEDITNLKASITSIGNLLPNAAFEVDTRAWTFFSHGTGWISSILQLNLEPERLPQALNVLSLTATGVPSGNAGIRSSKLPISAQIRYILSGYLAAENCTLRMEWRLYDAAGVQVDLGVVGQVTNISPATNLVNWTRLYKSITTPVDAATLEVQLWVTGCNTAPPKIWFLRPQLEEAVGTQELPSPWVPGSSGIESANASAYHDLSVRVTATEAGLLSQATNLLALQAQLSSLAHWRVVTQSGTGVAADVGAPLEAGLYFEDDTAATESLTRGLTLVRFAVDGTIGSITAYDTYASDTDRAALTAALVALGPNDGFLLVSKDDHGAKDPDLTAAMESCGAGTFSTVPGTTPYALRGRGNIGKGLGLETVATSGVEFIDLTMAVVNGMPQGLGDQVAIAGLATAVDNLDVRVTAAEGEVTAISSSNTELAARTGSAEGALVNALIIRASRDSVIASAVNSLSTTVGNNTATITQQQISLNGVLAKASLTLDVNGYVTGWSMNNDGTSGDMIIRADKFKVVDPVNSDTEYMAFEDGNLKISGILDASLIRSSALQLESTCIYTSDGRLAPFVIRDTAFVTSGLTFQNQTLTLDGFVGPDVGEGYNWKRFTKNRMDVYLEVLAITDSGDANTDQETCILEVKYDDGAWIEIIALSGASHYKSVIPIYVRYTTVDLWSTCAFRARTVQNRTLSLVLKVEVMNFNASGNESGTNSGSSGSGGSAPPITGGGGTSPPFCTDWETTMLPDGRYLRDLADGDLAEVVDVVTGERWWAPLLGMTFGYEDCYRVTTEHGEIIQSKSTPMDMRDGSIKRTPELQGEELLTHANGWEPAKIEFMGMRKVCKPDFGDRMFFAGVSPTSTIATHNIKFKPVDSESTP